MELTILEASLSAIILIFIGVGVGAFLSSV